MLAALVDEKGGFDARGGIAQPLQDARPLGQHKEAPAVYEALGFKDDPSKRDDEELFVGREAVPEWTPGRCMRGPIPGRTRILPRK